MHISISDIRSRRRFLQTFAGASALLANEWLSRLRADDSKPPALRDGKQLRVHTAEPLNAEPALNLLASNWITPVEHFYIRTHGNTPVNDGTVNLPMLRIEGMVERATEMLVAQLKEKFPKSSTIATMTCAGNRREEFNAFRKVGGVQWGAAAIGNAEWEGVRLSDVLKAAGVKEGAKHVWFESSDSVKLPDGSTTPFGASIPLEKAMADTESSPGALLATAMNGKPLPVDHGAPLRGVVPGYIGARSVKWLTKIVVSDKPSPNYFIQDVYKIVRTERPAETAKAPPIMEFPLNAAICLPSPEGMLTKGRAEVRGYALPPGSGKKASVEVSTDGGITWHGARITSPVRPFCWIHWTAEVPVDGSTSVLLARALTPDGTTQPRKAEWNLKGYLYDAWHRVPVKVQ